jgi:hypothetical protein
MNKPDCNITRKFLKREKGPADKIRRFLEKKHATRKAKQNTLVPQFYPPNGPSVEEIAQFKNKVQTRRLARFMKAVDPHKRRARYLNGVCSDSGVCIAFGSKDTKTIMKHFDGFRNFKHVKSLRKIGAVSANGFVKELEYENSGYKAHAVLKSSITEDSDNLYYEYLVGLFLNYINGFFPLFVTTYGAFKYSTDQDYEDMKKLNATKTALNGITLYRNTEKLYDSIRDDNYANDRLLESSCKYAKHMCVLIQHLKDATTLQDKCLSKTFVKADLPFSLFQIYYTLFAISDNFTHNDLHLENVLLYEPVKDSYIHYFYHLGDGSVISFYSHYVTNIIDYGRCFFENGKMSTDSHIYNSKAIHRELCKIPDCDPTCGAEKGYVTIHPYSNIKASRANISNDLRLLYLLAKGSSQFPQYVPVGKNIKQESPELFDLCNKVVFETPYITTEQTVDKYPSKIVNVNDAFEALNEFINLVSTKEENAKYYAGKKLLGELHVRPLTPIEFIPAV